MQGDEGDEVESTDVVEDIDLSEDDSENVAGGKSTGGVPLNKPIVGM